MNADVGSEYMATARPMDPPQERCEPRRPRGNDFGPKPGTADNNGSQQDVPPYVAQGAPKVNFNVGTGNISATARTMDPPQLRNKGHARRGNDFGPKPGTADENGSQQDVPPYVAQGAPKVNFNVRHNI